MSDTNGATLPVSPINDENPKHARESHTIRADEPEHFESMANSRLASEARSDSNLKLSDNLIILPF